MHQAGLGDASWQCDCSWHSRPHAGSIVSQPMPALSYPMYTIFGMSNAYVTIAIVQLGRNYILERLSARTGKKAMVRR